MYYKYTEWPGGIYLTPSFVGSRSGFASAGAWYALTQVGRRRYIDNAKDIAQATKISAKDLSIIDEVEIIGKPELCVIAFNTKKVDVYSVASYLNTKKGWALSTLHRPKGIHVSITPANCENVRFNLAKDVA